MGLRPSCRSCRHCAASSAGESGWCHLRRLVIHPELASELWCHHWTARPPRLPLGTAQETSEAGDSGSCNGRPGGTIQPHPEEHPLPGASRQLTFEALLPQF